MRTAVLVKVVDGEINPFDASAVEHALTLGGEVAVVSMGPKPWVDVLQPLTRLGVSRAILLSDPAFRGRIMASPGGRSQIALRIVGRKSGELLRDVRTFLSVCKKFSFSS